MIALKLVFQSLAGVAAVGSVASGGYYMFNIGEDQYFLVSVSDTSSAPAKELFADEPPKPSSLNSAPAGSLFLTVDSSHSSGTGGGTGTGTPAVAPVTTPPIVESAQQPSTSTPPAQEATSVEEKTTTQNYTCKNTDKKTEDKECKLFSITFDTTNKSIDLTTINTFIKAQAEGKTKDTDKIKKTINKSELTSKHFFILKASSAFVDHQMFESKKTITLPSTEKNGADKDKSYATLTLVAQLKEDKVLGKTNIAVVKAKTVDTNNATVTIPTDNSKTYTCTLQNVEKTELKGCSIQVLDSYSDAKTFNFSSITTPTDNTSLTITNQKHYLIKWTEAQKFSHLEKDIYFEIKPAKPATTAADVTTATPSKQTILSPISRLIVHPTTATFSEVITINK